MSEMEEFVLDGLHARLGTVYPRVRGSTQADRTLRAVSWGTQGNFGQLWDFSAESLRDLP
jgi:hypothetical protein